MKRYSKIIHNDYVDENRLAPKSSDMNKKSKSGDFKNSMRSTKGKKRIRKSLKSSYRQENKNFVEEEYLKTYVGDDEWEDESSKIDEILRKIY